MYVPKNARRNSMWEQQPERPIMVKYPSNLLWSNRGKLTKVDGVETARKLLQGRWREPTKQELERYDAGAYNPLYDYGENTQEEPNGDFIQSKAIGEVLEVIEI